MATSMPRLDNCRALRRFRAKQIALRSGVVPNPPAFVDSTERGQTVRVRFRVEDVVNGHSARDDGV